MCVMCECNVSSEVIWVGAVVMSFRIVTALPNLYRRTCLGCLPLTLFWTHSKVLVMDNAVRG